MPHAPGWAEGRYPAQEAQRQKLTRRPARCTGPLVPTEASAGLPPQKSHSPAALQDSPRPSLVNYKLSKKGHQTQERTESSHARVGRDNNTREREPRTSDLELHDLEHKLPQNGHRKRDGKSPSSKRPPNNMGFWEQGGRVADLVNLPKSPSYGQARQPQTTPTTVHPDSIRGRQTTDTPRPKTEASRVRLAKAEPPGSPALLTGSLEAGVRAVWPPRVHVANSWI